MPRPRQTIYPLTRALAFPSPDLARPDGLLAAYGDLSIERLLLAYHSGIFPWYNEDSPILWWSPPQRAILRPHEVHVSRSLRKVIRRGTYEIRWDTNFAAVIRACATAPRGDAANVGTWLVPEMQEAYVRLHQAGYAHSVESYLDGRLVGGLYGVSLGSAFFGESMFSLAPDASKVAFVDLCDRLLRWGFDLIDCQLMNQHLQRFGAYLIPRQEFLARLRDAMQKETRLGLWTCESAHAPD